MELDIYFAVAFFKKFAGPNYLEKIFRFFLAATKFVQVGPFFDNPVISDIDRNENHILTCTVFKGAEEDGQQPQLRHEKFAGPAASAFDKLFDMITFLEQLMNIFGENPCVEHRPRKRSAQEKSAAA